MLKLKDMPGTSYEDVVKSAEALGPADRLRLAAELIRRPFTLSRCEPAGPCCRKTGIPPFQPTGMNSSSG